MATLNVSLSQAPVSNDRPHSSPLLSLYYEFNFVSRKKTKRRDPTRIYLVCELINPYILCKTNPSLGFKYSDGICGRFLNLTHVGKDLSSSYLSEFLLNYLGNPRKVLIDDVTKSLLRCRSPYLKKHLSTLNFSF